MEYVKYHFTRIDHPRRGVWFIRCYIQYCHEATTEYSWVQYVLRVENRCIESMYREYGSESPSEQVECRRRKQIWLVAAPRIRNILKSMNRGGVTYKFYNHP